MILIKTNIEGIILIGRSAEETICGNKKPVVLYNAGVTAPWTTRMDNNNNNDNNSSNTNNNNNKK